MVDDPGLGGHDIPRGVLFQLRPRRALADLHHQPPLHKIQRDVGQVLRLQQDDLAHPAQLLVGGPDAGVDAVGRQRGADLLLIPLRHIVVPHAPEGAGQVKAEGDEHRRPKQQAPAPPIAAQQKR